MTTEIRVPRDIKDLDMRIAANGDWFYRGSKINREALVRLFSSVLRRDCLLYTSPSPRDRG